jgi:NAD(P)H-nitrite reductase large subunit
LAKEIVIIGNGIAGVTAARHIRKLSDHRIIIISSETRYFFSRTALMYVYMGHLKYQHLKPYEDHFWEKNRLELLYGKVVKVLPAEKLLFLSEGKKISYDSLIIGSGSVTRYYNWPGQQLKGVQGLYSWQDLELMEKHTAGIFHAVIVGGGLIGVEMAEMLRSRNIAVSFLIRELRVWGNVLPKEEADILCRHIQSHGIHLLFDTELKEIVGNEAGKVRQVITTSGETINCEFVGITTGVKPHVAFLKDSGIELNQGVLVNEYLQTNEENIYAIGDCAELRDPPPGRKKIEPVWYTGRMMGETVACTVCGEPTPYEPGIWFNSAKFFDIEYQSYGRVENVLRDDEFQLYWENEEKDKCVKLIFHERTGGLKGVNSLGIRLKQEVVTQWIKRGLSAGNVINQLPSANFDPEFYTDHLKLASQSFKAQMAVA